MDEIEVIDGVEYYKLPAMMFQNNLPSCFSTMGVTCSFLDICGKECITCFDKTKKYVFIKKME